MTEGQPPPTAARRIFLWGLMGSGKSTLGRQLAHLLDLPFADLDDATEALAGQAIPDIFAQHGEARFRELERQALHHTLASQPAGVFACGGGLPCHFDNGIIMNQAGLTLWLDVPLAELVRRLTRTRTDRPLLTDTTGERLDPDALTNRLRTLLANRQACYRQAQRRVTGPNLQAQHLLQAVAGFGLGL